MHEDKLMIAKETEGFDAEMLSPFVFCWNESDSIVLLASAKNVRKFQNTC